MMTRVVVAGLILMAVSGVTRVGRAGGECLPCSTPLFFVGDAAVLQDSTAMSFYVVAEYDPDRNPSDDLALAVTRAKSENKRILLVVGGEWCVWCHLLHDFLISHEQVTERLNDDYLMIRVNFSPENQNEAFLSSYPDISGYPHIYVLGADGSLLHSQRTDLLEEGRSYSESAILGFLDKWKPVR